MIFWRILDNKVYPIKEVNKLGFDESEGLRIPDEYLKQQNFTILRTTWGTGDWGIISSIPRLLKNKYPQCKVYVPSNKLIKKLFDIDTSVMYDIFQNNPYVDSFKDEIEGEIFHDHYRIYNSNLNTPLTEQILKFWQFSEDEYKDSQPELYWSKEEKELGDKIIKKYVGDSEFGSLLISERFGTQSGKYNKSSFINDNKKIINLLKNNKLPYFCWTHKPLNQYDFSFINNILDMRNMDLRLQLYIKSKSKINISNQCGTNHCVVRYSNVYEVQRQQNLKMNFVKGINYE
jgi:hypothetical protein|tara:strand:+ start:611 stop:1477 length:867 start_codon:yes stop_codon:yes gene_type:complete